MPPTISLANGVAYTQNFNALSNTAGSTTNVLTIDGWAMTETGGGARDNEQYAVDTGGSTTGDTFSYGAAANTDRALGELRSGTLIPDFGAAFTNASGATITSLLISYDGEQWRFGGVHATVAERLDFQISFDATDLTTGTWTDVNALDFNPTVVAGTAGAQDGNANHVSISSTITSLDDRQRRDLLDPLAGRRRDRRRRRPRDRQFLDHARAPARSTPAYFRSTTSAMPRAIAARPPTPSPSPAPAAAPARSRVDCTLAAPGGAGNADTADFVAGTVFSRHGQLRRRPDLSDRHGRRPGRRPIEGDEMFAVFLTNATGGATMSDDTGVGTITNDDSAGALSVNDRQPRRGRFRHHRRLLHRDPRPAARPAASAPITRSPCRAAPAAPTDRRQAGPTDRHRHLHRRRDQPDKSPSRRTATPSTSPTKPSPSPSPTRSAASRSATLRAPAPSPTTMRPPAASIGDVAVVEGDDGVVYLVFTVTLEQGGSGDDQLSLPDRRRQRDRGQRLCPRSGTGQLRAGRNQPDDQRADDRRHVPEANETLTVTLSNPVGGTIGDGSATGTITNDDGKAYYASPAAASARTGPTPARSPPTTIGRACPSSSAISGRTSPRSTGVDPRTPDRRSAVANDIDVIANQTNPNTFTSGGVAEFQLADPTIALQGSGTADAPHIVLYMDATGREDITVVLSICATSTARPTTPSSRSRCQYRISETGAWTNVPAGYRRRRDDRAQPRRRRTPGHSDAAGRRRQSGAARNPDHDHQCGRQ